RLRVGGLAPGEYTVVVSAPDQPGGALAVAPSRVDGVVVEAGASTKLEVLLEPGATVLGRVLDESGAPLSKADVWFEAVEPPAGYQPADDAAPAVRYSVARLMREGLGAGGSNRTATGPGGDFELHSLPAGRVRIVAKSRGLVRASTELALVPGETRSGIELVLKPGMPLAGQLVRPDGSPMQACVKVLVLPPGLGEDEVLGLAETGGQGEFRVDGLEPGPKRLLAVDGEGSWVDAPTQAGDEGQVFVASPSGS
ncbi:MAG TPA: hypothetical protein VFD43_03795, partial [Planctomycetota bacterium]|nr:hypothetical protein [Planctomycetota bacterium]